ncbi:NAD(P)H-dependent oxidoreductase [Neptunomonas marina]|uniref:Flavodoxin family protein n=1 Tax=Neptunomonas marina TaxID=1815562 RepID=A0A437Q953_9GAMM|nr:NAD(P)H-dependent oxidoreductase [Neptunomonas marina]RVU31006.1 flavodoxin family protein [Neptunomonas marina]
MNVLIVYWHPEPASFNAAMLRTAQKTLLAQGHDVQTSDLGAQSFNPVSGRHNFTLAANAEYFKQQHEEQHAVEQHCFSDDVAAELEKLAWCDLLLFQFPLCWFAMPAMVKGWIDRIFVYQQTYCQEARYECGRFTDKQALLAVTTGDPKCMYEPDGAHGDMLGVLKPIHRGVLAMTGFQVLPPFIAYEPAELSEQERIVLLDQYQSRLENITRDTPLSIPPFKN